MKNKLLSKIRKEILYFNFFYMSPLEAPTWESLESIETKIKYLKALFSAKPGPGQIQDLIDSQNISPEIKQCLTELLPWVLKQCDYMTICKAIEEMINDYEKEREKLKNNWNETEEIRENTWDRVISVTWILT